MSCVTDDLGHTTKTETTLATGTSAGPRVMS
jgi:hypothetical protein